MRIGIVYNGTENPPRAGASDPDSVARGEETARRIEAAIGSGHEVIPVRAGLDLGKRVQQGRFDVVFNAYEGCSGDAGGESMVAAQLEMAAVPFTGSGSLTLALCRDRAMCGRVLALVEEPFDGRLFDMAVLGNGVSIEVLAASQRTCELSEQESFSAAEAARSTFRLLGCRDYARIGIILRDGTPCVEEVDPNPGIGPESAFCRSAGVVGPSWDAMVWRILRLAMIRHGVEERPSEPPACVAVSERLTARHVAPSDMATLLSWFNDGETSEMMDEPEFRYTMDLLFDAFFLEARDEVDLLFVDRRDGRHVGYASIYHINRAAGSGEISFLIGDSKMRGAGFGREMVCLLVRHAFGTLGMNRLEATALPANRACLALLRSIGFRDVGIFRKRFSNGRVCSDEIIMERLRAEEC